MKQGETLALVGGAAFALAAYAWSKSRPGSTPAVAPGSTPGRSAGGGYSVQFAPPRTSALVPSVAIVAPPAPAIVTPAAPAPVVTPPAPAVGQSNDEFNRVNAYARQLQTDLYDRATDDVKARVASGQLVKGSAEYQSNLEYLANRGGVANRETELAKLQAQGF